MFWSDSISLIPESHFRFFFNSISLFISSMSGRFKRSVILSWRPFISSLRSRRVSDTEYEDFFKLSILFMVWNFEWSQLELFRNEQLQTISRRLQNYSKGEKIWTSPIISAITFSNNSFWVSQSVKIICKLFFLRFSYLDHRFIFFHFEFEFDKAGSNQGRI